jgi:hypothetical protein
MGKVNAESKTTDKQSGFQKKPCILFRLLCLLTRLLFVLLLFLNLRSVATLESLTEILGASTRSKT